MRIVAIAAALAVAGCATVEPIVKTEVREVRVPVVERCIAIEQIPQPPKSAMDPKGDTKQLAAGAVIDILELEAYANQLRARLIGCAR